MKVLYNTCYGGFNLSDEFVKEFEKRHPEKKLESWWGKQRSDPDVIALFEEMGTEKSSGYCSKIEIEEIPDDVEYHIREYDGMEGVSWSIPKDKIIQDLLDILKGRKKENEISKFTKILIEKDLTPLELRTQLTTSS